MKFLNTLQIILRNHLLERKFTTKDESNDKGNRIVPWFRQSVAAIGPLLCSMCVGLTMGYSTGLIPQLQESTHNGDSIMITKEDASWLPCQCFQWQLALLLEVSLYNDMEEKEHI
ncbi:uncharacterized protein LOC126750659 isoform X4 [Anthonomus grandis grandis]|uniref:uncharacterized protein LOC126750659 isoform X4 n=1 Tax=Anthonomus grandis grandis TaxID=2921223 RepID=UPI0021661A0D|nr:uncharacterized protein LOC126750659 isoform X4 [Anthonomus grandis grandis]